MPNDFLDPAYLVLGNARQQAAHRALSELGLFEALRDFGPVLVGTVPLDVDVEGSDLDLIGEAPDPARFRLDVERSFGGRPGFRIEEATIGGLPTIVANFEAGGFPVEIFGQPRPATQQLAYRHLLAEARLLAIGGEPSRRAVRDLKRAGLKTEPAFARVFGLEGDPYRTLAALADLDDDRLREALGRA